jgi:hypothetical protein
VNVDKQPKKFEIRFDKVDCGWIAVRYNPFSKDDDEPMFYIDREGQTFTTVINREKDIVLTVSDIAHTLDFMKSLSSPKPQSKDSMS